MYQLNFINAIQYKINDCYVDVVQNMCYEYLF